MKPAVPLNQMSLTDLRAIAQSYMIPDIFQKTSIQLVQAIELKQQERIPKPVIDIPKPEYDARLMTKPPAKKSSEEDMIELLKPYTDRGLHITFPEPERWHMQWGKKEDTGTMRMPLRTVLGCAERIMR